MKVKGQGKRQAPPKKGEKEESDSGKNLTPKQTRRDHMTNLAQHKRAHKLETRYTIKSVVQKN